MNTNGMNRLTELDPSQILSVVSQANMLRRYSETLNQSMESYFIRSQIIEVFKYYDLGTVKEVFEIFGGYVNRSFGVYTERKGTQFEYFVRMYKKGATEKDIQLEHALIDFAIANGLLIAAGPIRTNGNNTYVKLRDDLNADFSERYFAIYDFLRGEDKYTWDSPTLNDEEYASAAEVLATLHNATRDFDPQGREKLEPKIMELLPLLPGVYQDYMYVEKPTKFHRYFTKNLNDILAVVHKTRIPEEDLAKMYLNPIHSDFHPGNLKFKDNKVVGIFDFDWAKIDLRLFDICLAMVYSCCSWEDELDGVLLMDKCSIFLKSYQRTLANLDGLPPLNDVEIKYLPTMIAAANLYLINWAVTTYNMGTVFNVYEYLAYLQHNVRLMRWIESHKENLAEMASSI